MTRKIIEYNDAQERQALLEANSHLILIEEQNITEGNFLIFSDEPLPEPKLRLVYRNIPEEELESIKQSIVELTMILGGMA